jgi:FKBP-type peptidyl-prolyl cis-trans isomerase
MVRTAGPSRDFRKLPAARLSTSRERFVLVPNQKQRRDAARRHLERQLQARQARDARRKQVTLIGSIAGTLVLILAIIIVVVVASSSDKKTSGSNALSARDSASRSSSGSSSPAAPACNNANPTTFTSHPAKGAAVMFMGVTVKGATDLTGKPGVTSHGTKATKLEIEDLVVGKGKAASPTSCVTVQYDGVLYKNGKEFDSSWKRGQTAQFSLTQVVPGFTQGIGGTTGIAPMKVGGRRIMILPASLGYGTQASSAIPANSDLVFVVDLTKVS